MDNFFTFLEIYWYVAAQKPHIQSIAVKSQKPRIQTRQYIKTSPSQKPRIQTYIPQKMENYRKKYSKNHVSKLYQRDLKTTYPN